MVCSPRRRNGGHATFHFCLHVFTLRTAALSDTTWVISLSLLAVGCAVPIDASGRWRLVRSQLGASVVCRLPSAVSAVGVRENPTNQVRNSRSGKTPSMHHVGNCQQEKERSSVTSSSAIS